MGFVYCYIPVEGKRHVRVPNDHREALGVGPMLNHPSRKTMTEHVGSNMTDMCQFCCLVADKTDVENRKRCAVYGKDVRALLVALSLRQIGQHICDFWYHRNVTDAIFCFTFSNVQHIRVFVPILPAQEA